MLTVLFAVGCGDEEKINQPPSEPEISIVPMEPTYQDGLSVQLDVPAKDPEGSEISYTYTWFLNGAEQDLTTLSDFSGDSSSIPAGNLLGGQQWSVQVVASDGQKTSQAEASTAVTNTIPDVGLSLSSENPVGGDELTIFYSAVDPDQEEMNVELRLELNGEPYALEEMLFEAMPADALPEQMTYVIPSDDVRKGDIWSISLESVDSQGGVALQELEFEVANATPQIDTAAFVGSDFHSAQPIVVDVQATDPDDDDIELQFSWSVDGNVVYEESFAGASTSDALESCDQCGHWLPEEYLSRGASVTVSVTPVDSEMGETVDLEAVVLGNAPPEITAMEITPAIANNLSTLSCVVSEAMDADEDDITYEFLWEANGVSLAQTSQLDLSETELVRDDVLTCTAIPFDGELTGEAQSSTLTLSNAAPVVDSAEITDGTQVITESIRSELLTCSHTEAVDSDGDPVMATLYSWYQNGQQLSADAQTIEISSYQRGDEITCSVRGADAFDEGSEQHSASVELINDVPSIQGIQVTPLIAHQSALLTCAYLDYEDVDSEDSDLTLVEWLYGGQVISTGAELNIADFGYTEGDVLQCRVTPYDGIEEGIVLFRNVSVINAPPIIENIQIVPEDIFTDTSVSVEVDLYDVEGDAFTLSYRWYVQGTLLSNMTGPELSADFFEKDQDIYVEVVATEDVSQQESVAASEAVVVLNTPPPEPVLEMLPSNPYPQIDPIQCSIAAQPQDIDGDELTYEISWTVNGEPYNGSPYQTLLENDTIFAGETQVGDSWVCSVSIFDGSGAVTNTEQTFYLCPDGQYPLCVSQSCQTIYDAGYGSYNGIYYIDPDGTGTIEAYCDMTYDQGGWTMLLEADGSSAYWGNGSNSWFTSFADATVATDPPEEIDGSQADRHLAPYETLSTNELRLCYQDETQCYVFEHGFQMSLLEFFEQGESYVACSKNSSGYDDFLVSSSSQPCDQVGTYVNQVGFANFTIFGGCQWLGINHVISGSGIGLMTANGEECVYQRYAVGLGLRSESSHSGLAGGQAGVGAIGADPLGPWFVYGR